MEATLIDSLHLTPTTICILCAHARDNRLNQRIKHYKDITEIVIMDRQPNSIEAALEFETFCSY